MVAWFGFMFDLMDSTLYSLVMVPAVRDLLGGAAPRQQPPHNTRLWLAL
jgi:hypothetical protein